MIRSSGIPVRKALILAPDQQEPTISPCALPLAAPHCSHRIITARGALFSSLFADTGRNNERSVRSLK